MTEEYNVKAKQAQFLEELEELIDKTIPQVEEIGSQTFGFKVEGDNITGLGLYRQGLTTLPESIGDLESLQTLNLMANGLKTLPASMIRLGSLRTLNINHYLLLYYLPESARNLYKGIQLYTFIGLEQARALKDLNILIGKPIQRVKKMGYDCVGVKIFNGSIEELGLGSCGLINLPESI